MTISRIPIIRTMMVALALLGAGTAGLQAQFTEVEYVQADNAPWAERYTAAPDPEKAVGSISGALTVSPSGGAVYTLSIDLLPGIEGVQPALSLAVGSQGGDGVLGLGGSLSAMSSITRTGSTIHHDGISAGVQYDDRYDRLAWDGQRLVGLDGTGLAATEYRTDVESFARITRQGSGATASFTVRTKDGRTLRYGTTDAARLTYDGGCHTWMLCEVADLQGRYIRYNYAKDATYNEIRLASIEYTGTPSLAPQQRVEFTYGLRTDRWTGTTGPLKQAKTLLLNRIDVKSNGTFAWSYLLHYQLLKGRSCLTTVQKIAPDGSELNSTELLWDYPGKMQENYAASLPDWKTRPGQYQVRHFSGDFDGDGISDILTTKWNNSLIETAGNVCTFTLGGVDGMTRTTTYSLPRNQLFDRFDRILEEHGCSGSMPTVDFDQLSYGLQHLQDVLAADYDGDGITEMMFVCMEYDMNFETIIQQGICEAVSQPDFPLSKYTLPTGRYYCLVYSFKDRKFVHKTTTYSDFLPEYRATDRVNTFRFDFDNDGRSELLDGRDIYQLQGSNLVQIGTSDTDMSAHLVNTWGDFNGDGLMDFVNRSGYVYEREYGNYNYRYAGSITDKAILGVTDYDQDGEDELIAFDLQDSISMFLIRIRYGERFTFLSHYPPDEYHIDYYWDEGRTDLIEESELITLNPTEYVYFCATKNNGKGMRIYDKEGNELAEVEMQLFWDLTHVLNADIDNDGREDIVCFDDDMVRCIYYRTGDGYRREATTLSTGDDYFFGDYNGDGNIDLLSASNNRWWTFLSGLVPQPTLSAVRDGMGLRSEITYRPLTDPAVYAKGSGAAYPTLDLAGPVWVVTRIARDNGVAGTQVEHYAYRGAKANLHGKGFFGFSTVTVTDSVPGTTVTTATTYDDRCGLPLSSTQTTDMGGKTTRQTATYTIEAVNEAQKRYRQRLASRQETDLSGNVVNTTYAEDAYGNPTRETVNYGSGVTAETRTWYRTVDNASRYVCLPDSQTVTRTRGGRHWVEGVRYTYDADCRPLGKVEHTGYHPTATEEYTYNAQGFVAAVKSKPYASNHWLTTTYEYDNQGCVTKETDPLGLSATYEYDDIGLLMSATDARDNETSYTYDGFGRRVTTRQPDGVTRTEQPAWYTGTDAPDGTLYYVQSAATGQPTSRTYYDATGRELRHEQLRFNGKWLKTDKQYDARGRLWKTSLPSNTTPNRWDVYSYDGQDRPVRIGYSSGKEDLWAYSPNTVQETREGVRSTKRYDASGALLSVDDPGGTITYHLRPDGQPDSISLKGGVVTRFEYDEYGRQLQIDDPSAGVQTYTYDEAGNVSTQTDANGKTTSFAYDDYGRVTQRTCPEFTTGYVYNAYGEVQSETSTNWTSRTFTYDHLGRMASELETLPDGVALQKAYTYAQGNVGSVEYSTQNGLVATETYHYTNGHLSEIKLDGQTSIWKLQTENVRGLATKVLTGDVTRAYTYDTDGLPTGRVATRAGVTVFAQGYSFDAGTGNLEERRDETRGLAELFAYDHLNRLTGWQVQQDGTRTATHRMAYEANGNLTYLDGTGTLEYAHPRKPYAVTGVYAAGAIPEMGFEHEIEYTSFYRPAYIRGDTAQTQFTYNASGERVKMATQASRMNIRYYLGGCYEAEPQQGRELLYLGGDAYSAPAVYVRQGNTWQVYYIIRDYLGSICAITNSGGLVAEYSYDPWGNLRDPETLEAYAPGTEPELFLGRGFTGHEHLTAYGLVNMNARLYDPMTGRFLSPDPYVQAPDFSQAFNRFSYCWNNPLRFVDEDGEFIIAALIIGAAFGAAIGAYSGYKVGKANGAKGWDMAGYILGGAAIGAIGGGAAGAAGAAVGAAVSVGGFLGGAAVGATAGAVGGFINGAGMSWLGGSSFLDGLKAGGIAAGIGGLAGGLAGGITQGFADLAKGNSFWDGFDYQSTLDQMVAQEGINNPNSKFLVANKRNAKLVNENFGPNTTKVRGNKIFMNDNSYSKLGVNFGTKGKGNITLISKQAIRNRGDFVLLDVLRHEGTHQAQVLLGMTDIRQMEIKAYMTNILNPATPTTIQKVSNILINDWNVSIDMLNFLINKYHPNVLLP